MTPKKQSSTIFILGLLTALGPFSIDMYLPGFRDIADNLHTSVATVGLSLSSYFIGISAGQLLYGPLLDRHGRKKPLYAGLLLYILSSASCLVIKDINVLIILRFIQAVGSCAAAVGSMAMVRDLFGAKDSARVFSLLLLVVGASPMIAPTAGGYVITLFGWRSVFVILTIMGILILLLSIFALPESHQPDPNFSLRPRPIINNFLSVLRNRQFLVYSLTGSLAWISTM
jgi:DHA1 family bicyclomycin/chloramphenicol resistance-like MFS transporter